MSLLKMASVATIVLLASGCASDHGVSVAETTPDKFVTYACENSKSFSARFSAEASTIRIRTMDGAAELSKGDRGLYRDEAGHWILTLGAESSTELIFKGKPVFSKCVAKI
ncbi:MAG: hypothetical protein Q7U91_05515 [Sideroxyarcus sp.]|nr:hypothetical protein [Sideroxyarcus sp.]